jgi:hypothetical protein
LRKSRKNSVLHPEHTAFVCVACIVSGRLDEVLQKEAFAFAAAAEAEEVVYIVSGSGQ